MKKIYLLLVVTLLFLIIGCDQAVINNNHIPEDNSSSQEELELEENNDLDLKENEDLEVSEEVEEETSQTEEEVIEEIVDPSVAYRENHVNETGQLLVIMYHNLSDQAGAYATTKDLFMEDLERLYAMGFVTISMTDLINNTIDIPMGKTPVVLTFDDATKSNFYYDETGSVSKDSVVGILDDFSKKHEGFGKNAIFYIYGSNPFRERESLQDKLDYLLAEGYEIGTHTYTHDFLNELTAEGIQRTMAKNQAFLYEYLDYEMVHLSVPYGVRPSKENLDYMYHGQYEGVTYDIQSAVNVGWNPIYSPSHVKFNPLSINRVTCGKDEAELHYWLDYFENNPEKRYYSDGDPATTVIPAAYADQLKNDLHTEVIIYEEVE